MVFDSIHTLKEDEIIFVAPVGLDRFQREVLNEIQNNFRLKILEITPQNLYAIQLKSL